MSQTFRKRPVMIQAMQFTGSMENVAALQAFAQGNVRVSSGLSATIETPEGTLRVVRGDWVIQGIAGEFYPCKPDIFAATYEEVPSA